MLVPTVISSVMIIIIAVCCHTGVCTGVNFICTTSTASIFKYIHVYFTRPLDDLIVITAYDIS